MFTKFTYTDWEKARSDAEKINLIQQIVAAYKESKDFKNALTAKKYYEADNEEVGKKVILSAKTATSTDANGNEKRTVGVKEIVGNRVYSDFFARFVKQEAGFLLGNGVTLDKPETKKKLGAGFDTVMYKIGRNALVQALCYGYWNRDHIEMIEAAKDALSGAVGLVDEMSSDLMVLVQFWQIDNDHRQFVRTFEPDGVTVYKQDEEGQLRIHTPKRSYIQQSETDGLGKRITGGRNYDRLPVVAMYGNDEHRSELKNSLKSKIDLYDRIFSDFGDNLDKANDVYWVLNNFGGSMADVLDMLQQIQKLKAIANISDGSGGGSTAEPHSFEVPYQARQTALTLLERAMYSDFMGLDMKELTGGSLTNVAIKTAMTNLNLKADGLEFEAFSFVQSILRLLGIETEVIKFKRRDIVNDTEIIDNIYTMRADISHRKALTLNPYIDQDDIEEVIQEMAEEEAVTKEHDKGDTGTGTQTPQEGTESTFKAII